MRKKKKKTRTVSVLPSSVRTPSKDSLRGGPQRAIVVADAQVQIDKGPVVREVDDIVRVAVYAQGRVVVVERVTAHGAALIDGDRLIDAVREGLDTRKASSRYDLDER